MDKRKARLRQRRLVQIFDGSLSLTIGPGFRDMDQAELALLVRGRKTRAWGARDAAARQVMLVSERRLGALTGRLAGLDQLRLGCEQQMRKAYADASFELGDGVDRTACGVAASGFDYTYEHADTAHVGRLVVWKLPGRMVTFQTMTPKARARQALREFDEALSSMADHPGT